VSLFTGRRIVGTPRLILAENGSDFLPAIHDIFLASIDQIDLSLDDGGNVVGGFLPALDILIEAEGVSIHVD